MKFATNKPLTMLVCCVAVAACSFLLATWGRRAWVDAHPQFRDSLAQKICAPSGQNCWQAFGGAWQRNDGSMVNSSDDRGAKIMNGSIEWRDYVVEADLELLGESGDAGLVVRSTKEDVGVDAYDGYFAGIRSADDTLILGRSDYGWRRFRKVPTQAQLKVNTWYHLKLMVYQCWLFTTFTDERGQQTSTAFRDDHCYPNGRFGLKSYYVPTAWRNINVYQASKGDFEAMLKTVPSPDAAAVPDLQEASDALKDTRLLALLPRSSRTRMSGIQATPIAELILRDPTAEQQVLVRGVVTMLKPQLFVQDSTGALSIVDYESDRPLQIGNAVEVSGLVDRGDYSVSLQKARVQTMWSHAALLPIPVPATLAAGGAYDKQLIQTEGLLQGLHRDDGNRLVLTLQEGQQTFVAYAFDNGLNRTFDGLQTGSRLRLSGVCVIDGSLVSGAAAFAVLMRSFEDVTVVQAPPWWNGVHIFELLLAAILLSLVVQYAVHAIQRMRMHATIEERQRLAMELHDSLAQSFAGIGFRLEALRAATDDTSPLRPQLASTIEMLRFGHKEARRNIAAISPGNLEGLGLCASLQNAARAIVQDGAIVVETEVRGEQKPIPLRIEDALLRIGQEAIANAVRHAKPSTILLTLAFGTKSVRMSVRDDGTGFLYGQGEGGYGILGMGERARAIGARLRIGSSPGRGTVVVVRVNLSNAILQKVSWRRLSSMLRNGHP